MKNWYNNHVGSKYPRADWTPRPCYVNESPNVWVIQKTRTVLEQGASPKDIFGNAVLIEVRKHGEMTLARAKEIWNRSQYRTLLGRCTAQSRDKTMVFKAVV